MVMDTKYQDGTNFKLELVNTNTWFKSSSTTCIVTNGYSLLDTNGISYSSTSPLFSITYNELQHKIVYTTDNNYHVSLVFRARTLGNVAKSVGLRFDVCG